MARENAAVALHQRLADRTTLQDRLAAVARALELPEPPERIECFDVSHTDGEATVASCVVFGPEGAIKSDYRRFNIRGVTPGDDYAAMQQVLTRRFAAAGKGEEETTLAPLPDLLLIDGGRGQLDRAVEVLGELALTGVETAAVAKGPGRKPAFDSVFRPGRAAALRLREDSPALHLIQQIRDEAHRFAITGHRSQRNRRRRTSTLESFPGIGPVLRQRLLSEFGGLPGGEAGGDRGPRPGPRNQPPAGPKHLRTAAGRGMNVPIAFTLFRIALVPVFVVAFYLPLRWANEICAIAFALAAITDWLDGFLARRLQQTTIFGAFLDPVADKLMVAVALVLLVQANPEIWVALPAATIIGREIAISALREWMARIGEHRRVAVVMMGKFKTFCQLAAIVLMLYGSGDVPEEFYLGGLGLLYVATALTLWSMVQYLVAARSLLRAEAGQPGTDEEGRAPGPSTRTGRVSRRGRAGRESAGRGREPA